MPRSGPNGTYTLPGAQDEAQPNTTIQSSINNQGWADIEQTFNTVQPIAYGGTGAATAAAAAAALEVVSYAPQVLSGPQQAQARANIGVDGEAGAVMAFARNSAPTGWLKANGAAVSRATYAALYAAIGTTFGAGDGSTTFNLPDLRGEFVRGWDDGRGVDSGRAFGSAQSDQNKQHKHTGTAQSAGAHSHTASSGSAGGHNHDITMSNSTSGTSNTQQLYIGGKGGTIYENTNPIASVGNHSHSVTVNSGGAHTHTLSINNEGGNEARPRNVALLYCIKY